MLDTVSRWWQAVGRAIYRLANAYPLALNAAVLTVLAGVVAAALIFASCAVALGNGQLGAAPGNPGNGPYQASVSNDRSYEHPDGADAASARDGRALEQRKTICIDPGHGGPSDGAVNGQLKEKDVNLKIALKLRGLLEAEGYNVVLTRDSDRAPSATAFRDWAGVTEDLQARVDIANAVNADLFISIHNNAAGNASVSGTEVWYSGSRTFGDENKRLAELVQAGMLNELRAIGYNSKDLGIKDDINFGAWTGRAGNIYVLGPGTNPPEHVPTQMPGVLGESLFLSNSGDAQVLSSDSGLDAIAKGYRNGIVSYFERAASSGEVQTFGP